MSTFVAKPLSELDQVKMRFYAHQKLVGELRTLLGRTELSAAFKADVSAELYRLVQAMDRFELRWDEIEGVDR